MPLYARKFSEVGLPSTTAQRMTINQMSTPQYNIQVKKTMPTSLPRSDYSHYDDYNISHLEINIFPLIIP